MSTVITVTITVNSGFRISTGQAVEAADAALDHDNPLPGRSLKGDLRASARQLLPGTRLPSGQWDDDPLVKEVFGERGGDGCPWHFGDAVLDEVHYRPRTRIALDTQRRVVPGAMLVGEEAHTAQATQTITQIAPLDAERLKLHAALLHVSARLIDGVGHGRRRGLGWVTITTDAPRIDDSVELVMDYTASRKKA